MRSSLLWTLAAAASAEVVRLGYFGEAQPFQVACARGWFDFSDVTVACLPQASGGYVVSKLDEGDLEVAAPAVVAREVVQRDREHRAVGELRWVALGSCRLRSRAGGCSLYFPSYG